ncbi:MAG: DUF2017 family protein [Acidimicrobiia bacterium]|nr:DUF2017 family protein [Acidimicrobiia bacterium]
MSAFRRRGPEIDLQLSEAEAELLGLALPVLAAAPPAAAGSPPGYPHFCAHPEDEVAEAGFRELTAGCLRADREADRRRFAASLERGTLGTEDAAAWMRVLAEARLALAARLGVAETGWERASPGPGLALLHLYGCLQEELGATLLPT